MGATGNGCRRLAQIALREAEGRPLTEAERKFVKAHLNECESCRSEEKLLGLLASDESGGVVERLDDVSRSRLLNNIMDRWERGEKRAREPISAVGPGQARQRHWLPVAVGGAVAGVTATAIALLFYLKGPGDEGKTRETRADGRTTGRVLMVSGTATSKDTALKAGDTVSLGTQLTVGQGDVALRLGPGLSTLVGSNSVVRVTGLGGTHTSLHVKRGYLLGWRVPGSYRGGFTIRTQAGIVKVTGTVFVVRAGNPGVEVMVLRGEVKVIEPGRPARSLPRGRAAVLGTGKNRALTPSEEEVIRLGHRRLDLLMAARPASLLVASRPTGASVMVDGTFLGKTPLTALIKEGERKLEVVLEGYASIREYLKFHHRETYRRDFDLKAAGPAPTMAAVAPEDPNSAYARRTNGSAHRPAATAGDLMKEAWKRLKARDWAGAARVYRRIIRTFPKSGAARSARVSLGGILLDHLRRPGRALQQFNRYLKTGRNDALAREAAYGRIRALKALGRRSQEITALKDFLRRYPSALQAGRVRARLKKLQQPRGDKAR